MNGKKLIKGIIYEDENILADAMYNTLESLNYLVSTDEGRGMVNEVMKRSDDVPSIEEFITSLTIDTIVHPSPYHHNMIIPSSAVAPKLYEDLRRIDIGEYLQDAFIEYTVEYHRSKAKENNESEEQGYEIVQGGPNGNVYKFHSKEDLIDFIETGYKNGIFSNKNYNKMMSDIERLSA